MSMAETLTTATAFVEALGSGAASETILAMFSEEMDFELPGDAAAFPWIGKSTGRSGLASLLDGLHRMLVLERFQVHDIVAGETRAVIIGALASRVVATGKLIESPFAIVLTVAAGTISQFLMLEDSFAVSVAARD